MHNTSRASWLAYGYWVTGRQPCSCTDLNVADNLNELGSDPLSGPQLASSISVSRCETQTAGSSRDCWDFRPTELWPLSSGCLNKPAVVIGYAATENQTLSFLGVRLYRSTASLGEHNCLFLKRKVMREVWGRGSAKNLFRDALRRERGYASR